MRPQTTAQRLIAAALIALASVFPLNAVADCTVNINTASAEDLAECLLNIGSIRAEAIVVDREDNGPFETVDDLQRVDGIGRRTVDRNRDRIRLNGPARSGDGTEPAPVADDTNTDSLALASWNVRNLSSSARSDAELGLVALILFRYDFIALQEVLDAEVIFRLQQILADDFRVRYEMQASQPVGRDKKEQYVFMWRGDRVTQPAPAVLYPDPGDRFEREPYCGLFRAGSFDWIICTVHILFGDSEAERRPEIQQLDEVYQHFKGQGGEQDVIICGDFNFGPDDEGFEKLLTLDGMQFAISPPATTTIGDTSLYDNCFWSEDSSEIVADSGQVLEFDELMFPPGSRSVVNRMVSDHRPISLTVRPAAEDDD